MLNFYKKIFRIFCRVTDNPVGGQKGNFPQHMAFVGTGVLCFFNLITVISVIKFLLFPKSWFKDDTAVLLIIGLAVLSYFYFLFLHNDKYEKYIDLNVDKTTQKKENWFLGLYIFASLFLLVAVPLLIRSLKYGFLK